MATQTETKNLISILGDVSLRDVLEWLSTAMIGLTVAVDTAESTCAVNDVTRDPGSLTLKPSLIYPARFSSAGRTSSVSGIDQLVRHGIVVKSQGTNTSGQTREIYVFLGGYSQAWAYNVNKLGASQSGLGLSFSSDSNLIGRLLSGSYGITAVPMRPHKEVEFVSEFIPPASPCRSGIIQDITEFGAFFEMGMIPSFVPDVYRFIAELGLRHGQLFDGAALKGNVADAIRFASEIIPTWLPAQAATENPLSVFGIPGYVSYPNTLSSIPVEGGGTSLFSAVLDFFGRGVGEFPMIEGAPFFANLPCTGECEQLGLAGFVGDSGIIPDLEESYQGASFVVKSSYLVPPPRSYNFNDIVEYANSRGVGQAFIQAVDLLVDAIRLEEALVKAGLNEEEADLAVDQLEWTAELFERGIENLARDIVEELKAPSHPDHTDPVGQQVHRTYLYLRLGNCT